ncbi:oligosaccharide flippase family protein [Rhizosphaericola mali]|uniref:Oligosaccharide flippase family protein n=1 Tax=Rhizosphaericola mali TaxID=2545455 RepID=A0A5P2G1K8_9BACT|nr:oligosaccharide flippase family protein [Rhizosphaericola mali]QES89315.1 oligosaccharide flippase family protein [Rhizosphaericola mali]
MSHQKEKNKLLGNIASLGLVNIANYLFPIITIPIVSRALGPDKIGRINYIASFLTYFTLIIAYSFNATGVRRIAVNAKDSKFTSTVFSNIFFAQLYLFLISSLIFIFCLVHIKKLNQEFQLTIISYLICLTSLFTQNWLFQAKQDLKIIAFLNFLPRLVSLFFVIFYIHKDSDYIKYALILYVIPLIISLISFLYSIYKYKIQIFIPKIKSIITMLNEDKIIFISIVLINFYTTTGIVILGNYKSENEVAYYTCAQKLIDIGRSILMLPISQAVFPLIAETFGKRKEDGSGLIKNIMPGFIVFTLLVLILTILLGPLAVSILYGEKFMPVIPILEVLAWGAFFVFYGVIFGNIMISCGLDKSYLKFTFWGAVISLFFNFLFVKHLGALGTAIVWSLSELFITFYQFKILKKNGIRPLAVNSLDFKLFFRKIKLIK